MFIYKALSNVTLSHC